MIGLIAGSSGDSLVDELHKRDYSVAIVCGKKNEPGFSEADCSLAIDLSRHEEIYNFFALHSVSKVIFGTGHTIAFTLAEYLLAKGISLNIDPVKCNMAKDKYKFKRQLEALGINTPKTLWADDISKFKDIKELSFPYVFKSTSDKFQPCKINNMNELELVNREVLRADSKVLVEEYIDGNDCTVAVVNDGNIIKSLGVTYYSKAKEYKLRGFNNAYSKKMTCEKEREICRIAEEIVRKLHFFGLVRIDFIVSEEIYVLELNSVIVTGYTGSAYPFFKKQGINIASVLIDNALTVLKARKTGL